MLIIWDINEYVAFIAEPDILSFVFANVMQEAMLILGLLIVVLHKTLV